METIRNENKLLLVFEPVGPRCQVRRAEADSIAIYYLPRIIPKAELTLIMTEASVPVISRASNLPLYSNPNDWSIGRVIIWKWTIHINSHMMAGHVAGMERIGNDAHRILEGKSEDKRPLVWRRFATRIFNLGGKADPEAVCNLCVILKFMLYNHVSTTVTQHCLQLYLYTYKCEI